MAVFIPELLYCLPNNIRRHVSRSLKELPDDYLIRVPVRPESWPADLVIERDDLSWLSVVVVNEANELSEKIKQVSQQCKELHQQCIKETEQSLTAEVIVIAWKAKSEKPFSQKDSNCSLHVVGRKYFQKHVTELITQYCKTYSERVSTWIRKKLLPEIEIPPACTTRTIFNRDNSAILTSFFLDYDQELAAKMDLFNTQPSAEEEYSVRLINGVAGSGKTLIIVSRILMYCEKNPDHRVLLLIHNTPVTADIKYRISQYWGGVPGNLEITTFWSWCYQQWTRAFRKRLNIEFNQKRSPNVTRYISEEKAKYSLDRFSDQQLFEEVDFINANLIFDQGQYIDANRAGRGFSLRAEERNQIWHLCVSVNREFGTPKALLSSLLPKQLCAVSNLETYHHIIVDEAQFFAPSWFELIKCSLKDSSLLFMCADPNQGFLKNRLSWKSAGINVRGRTKILHRSYRTTYQILRAAHEFLTELYPDSGEDYQTPSYKNMMQGPVPILFYKDSHQDCIDQTINEIKHLLDSGIPNRQIMVLYTGGTSPWELEKRLKQLTSMVWNFATSKKSPPSTEATSTGFLKLAQLETATGLEAGIVFILGLEKVISAYENLELTEDEKSEAREESARKLYMAMTRAGQRLIMFSKERMPAVLEKVTDVRGSSY